MKARCIYTDKAGNKLYKRTIKTRGTIQYSAKNREGRVVNESGAVSLMRKAGLKVKKR